MSIRKIAGRNPLYLPAHIANSFERSLNQLITDLPKSPKNDYLKSEYLSKYLDPKIVAPDVRQTAAVSKWLAAEVLNGKTNIRLLLGEEDFGWTTSDLFIKKARAFISEILGPLQDLKMGSHTNGASTRIRRRSDAAILKHAGTAHVSSRALGPWKDLVEETILSSQDLVIQNESVLFTVAKKTEIDRVACKEPEINMFLQRELGSMIRTRLRRVGIDLNDQSKNQRLAQSALADNSATVDLSSASDMISHQLVFELLPFEWFSALDDLRSSHVILPSNEIHELSMFSSMGNGFTFELESLIFYALTRTVCFFSGIRGVISVYGDDIICPSLAVPRLSRVFSWFGFIVNQKKTNHTGLFRESCGSHYYDSKPITPFYIRESVTKMTDLIRLLNRLFIWSTPYGFPYCFDSDISDFHQKWSKCVPYRLHGGDDPEDVNRLFTDDLPRSTILQRKIEMAHDHTAALALWFTLADRRPETAVSSMIRSPYRPTKANHLSWIDTFEFGLSVKPSFLGRSFYSQIQRW